MGYRHGFLSIGVVLVLLALAAPAPASDKAPRIQDEWRAPDVATRQFENILVVGISDDAPARRRFEDKFVSHIRGRKLAAETSYSIVPHLEAPPEREKVLQFIADEEIDAVISIRLVPMRTHEAKHWPDAWQRAVGYRGRLRDMISETLEDLDPKAARYGVEIALWDIASNQRIWEARTDALSIKKLRKASGDLVDQALSRLKNAGLL